MITTTVTMPGDFTVTVSCEYSDDIRTIMREVLLGLKDYADECGDQKKKDEKHKKINSYCPIHELSIPCHDYENAKRIVRNLCEDIDEYGNITISDLKDYVGLSTDIQDTHYGVNLKRDIIITPYYDGCLITLKNLIEVD